MRLIEIKWEYDVSMEKNCKFLDPSLSIFELLLKKAFVNTDFHCLFY